MADRSIEIMRRQGVTVDVVRAIDHSIATGVWPDMTEHGWDRDDWPAIFDQVIAAAEASGGASLDMVRRMAEELSPQ